MPTQAKPRSRRRDSRTDARRRARQRDEEAAAANEATAADAEGATATQRPRQPLLKRLLPDAPPLPGKGDPLAGFRYRGPRAFQGLAETGYLLRRNPLAWMTPSLAVTLARLMPLVLTQIAFLSTTVELGAMVVAGALGWQRPWLYGATAAFVGTVIFAVYYVVLLAPGAPGVPTSPTDIAVGILSFAVFQGLLGALAGWFGGYWRRRFAEASAMRRQQQQQAARRPRR